MLYKSYYNSPIGKFLLVANNDSLLGLWLEGQKYFPSKLNNFLNDEIIEEDNLDILVKTKNWLDRYFNKEKPEISELKLAPVGNEFRQKVWDILCDIPYGKTVTYGEIAKKVAIKMNRKSMSAQAVGNAVGHNPISIIIPCHRVVGKHGNLTGYAGGIENKIKLLEIENAISKFNNRTNFCNRK